LGNYFAAFRVTNSSSSACALNGYPGVALYGAGGRSLTSPEARGHTFNTSRDKPHRVVIGAHRKAYFILVYRLVTPEGRFCGPVAKQAQVRLPGLVRPQLVKLPVETNKDKSRIILAACRSGFNVSAIAPLT
jgi:hypothetical protein